MISTKGRYALRVIVDIAVYSNGNYIALKDISKREEISLKYLEQVIQLLVKANIIQSLRGNNGGYRLARPAESITAKDVLKASEGTLAPVACLKECNNTCTHYSSCSTIGFWKKFDSVIDDYVGNVTISDLANDYKTKIQDNYVI